MQLFLAIGTLTNLHENIIFEHQTLITRAHDLYVRRGRTDRDVDRPLLYRFHLYLKCRVHGPGVAEGG